MLKLSTGIVVFIALCICSLCLAAYPVPPYYAITFANDGVDRLREVENLPTQVKKLSEGHVIESTDYLTTGPQSYSEIKAYGITLRQGSDTITQWMGDHHWKIIDGSVMFCLEDKMTLTVSSLKGSAKITGPCTFIAEATSNGGYKFITLSGNPYIETKEKKLRMPAGRLVLVLGEQESLGNAYDVDIMLLLQSSLLFNAFEDPPPTMKKIGLAVFAQQKRMKGKYNALIGDATSDKNLQMWILGNQ
jgi:hypothetical protein